MRTRNGWEVFLDDGQSLLTERSGARLAADRAAQRAAVVDEVVAHGAAARPDGQVRLSRSRG
jgi:hypothetical protein